MPIDMDKAQAELEILRGFIDFVNAQVGVYTDCLAGFEGNAVRIKRQVPRAVRPAGRRIENGQTVIVHASLEDPSRPDVIHQRIFRADDYIAKNSPSGFNEQQICWSIIVFLFAYWDEEIRPRIAATRGVKPNDVTVDALGDVRIIRHSILHEKGTLSAADHAKLKKMAALFKPNEKILLSHDEMHQFFVAVKQGIAEIIMEYGGQLPGAPDPSEITDIAIQRVGQPPE